MKTLPLSPFIYGVKFYVLCWQACTCRIHCSQMIHGIRMLPNHPQLQHVLTCLFLKQSLLENFISSSWPIFRVYPLDSSVAERTSSLCFTKTLQPAQWAAVYLWFHSSISVSLLNAPYWCAAHCRARSLSHSARDQQSQRCLPRCAP